jgi:hypothetical protein
MNFVYLRRSRLHIFKFETWFMHWQQGGERKVDKSCMTFLEPIPRVKGELVHFFCIFDFWGVWSAVRNRPDRFGEPIWPVLGTGLTGLCPGLALVQGEHAYVQGELLFALLVCALFLSMVFVSDVSSHCPCLRGLRFVFFKWSCSLPFLGFRSLVGVFLFVSFCFPFLYLPNVCVVNALIKGEIVDHVWFEDW